MFACVYPQKINLKYRRINILIIFLVWIFNIELQIFNIQRYTYTESHEMGEESFKTRVTGWESNETEGRIGFPASHECFERLFARFMGFCDYPITLGPIPPNATYKIYRNM